MASNVQTLKNAVRTLSEAGVTIRAASDGFTKAVGTIRATMLRFQKSLICPPGFSVGDLDKEPELWLAASDWWAERGNNQRAEECKRAAAGEPLFVNLDR